jgi:prepilin-type N-terminal cleavage/methylation domain-containing protein
MIGARKNRRSTQPKRSRFGKGTGGFTLIELLVAIILAALVITPLLGFMINILTTDRREQAKANTAQDIQSALEYISRDVEQAVYIYDGEGIEAIKDQLPGNAGEPLLVFWKRQFLPNAIAFDYNANPNGDAKCPNVGEPNADCNDAFVFSLVTYYLITDTDADQPWSHAARVARVEIQDGIRNPNNPVTTAGEPNYLEFDNKPRYNKDPGFQLFNLEAGNTLENAMNAWQNSGETFNKTPVVLVDYIDQTENNPPDPINCASALGLDTATLGERDKTEDDLNTLPPNSEHTSFYACVDTEETVAQVYLRGNAEARIRQNPPEYKADSPDFPDATIKVQGRGFLFK